jgi:hypothetical protein
MAAPRACLIVRLSQEQIFLPQTINYQVIGPLSASLVDVYTCNIRSLFASSFGRLTIVVSS